MMKDLIKISLLFLLALDVVALEEFRNSKDRRIVYSVLDNFSKNCSLIMTLQDGIIFNLEKKLKLAQMNKEEEILKCYSNNLNKIKSVHFIYKNICTDLTQDGMPVNDESIMRLFVSSRQYRKGILVTHSVLNECLIGKAVNKDYIVDAFSGKKEFNLLVSKLKRLKRKSEFIPNRVNFR